MRFSGAHWWSGIFAMIFCGVLSLPVMDLCAPCLAQQEGLIRGVVQDEQTGEILTGVNVVAVGTSRGAATDPQGQFKLWLPVGTYWLRLEIVGYRDLNLGPFHVQSGSEVKIDAHLEEEVILLDEILVVGERKRALEAKQASANFLEQRQLEDLSGSAEDVLRTIQTLPGVVSPADFTGRVFVRGGRSSENVVVMDRVFIYEPYHLGGAVSIFNPELIEHVEFYAGGYPAKYGMATSAILRVFNKTGMESNLEGEASLSLISANAVLQGRLPGHRGHWILSARRSYHDKLMEIVGAFENYVFPHFHDLQLKATYPVNKNHTLTFSALHSGDALKVELENPDDLADAPADSGDLAWDNQLAIASLDWSWFAAPKILTNLTFAFSKQPFSSQIMGTEPQWFSGQARNLDINADVTLLARDHHELEMGVYLRETGAKADINIKQDYLLAKAENSNVALDTTMLRTSFDEVYRYGGIYLQDQWEVVPPILTFGYGLRYEAMNTTAARPLSPRFHLAHRIGEKTLMKFSWGHYYQFAIDPIQMEPPLGSRELKPQKAIHYILGLDHQPTANTKLRLEGYVKELSQRIVIGPEMQFANYGRGDIHGLELFLEKRPGAKLDGWASYSYSVARNKDILGTPEYPPMQDQKHTASLVLNYRFNSEWRTSLRWMAHSGKPYTPVLGAVAVVDSASGELIGNLPLEGIINSERFPSYQRLDVRVDRFFQFDNWNLNIYFEVLNLYNHKNVYDYSYTKDYLHRIATFQFPILPSVGIKMDF
ncbi:TonB-dependent receptor domain-containing protein [Candidatus Zixiibacteriota bacterium]